MPEPKSEIDFDFKTERFSVHRVPARTNLLDFAAGLTEGDLYSQIAEDPRGWMEELSRISILLGQQALGSLVGISLPDESQLTYISDDVRLSHTEDRHRRGLWVNENGEWHNYNLREQAVIRIAPSFSNLDPELLLPGKFSEHAELVKNDKRPIMKFTASTPGRKVDIFAKGSVVTKSFYFEYSKPSYRKTFLHSINRTPSLHEQERFEQLGSIGVGVPKVIATYEGLDEQWLFVEAVKGREIPDWLDDEKAKAEIIKQDAEMLGALCRLGYRKFGFADFDDKLFDGQKLYLIDTDELQDLYGGYSKDFRNALLDPKDQSKLDNFREMQRVHFLSALRDAIYEYRETLLPDEQSRLQFISHFMADLGWEATEDEIESLLNLPSDYMTMDRYLAIMAD